MARCVTGCLLALLCGCAGAPDPRTPGEILAMGRSYALPSEHLPGAPREINVWLPASYATGERAYPVLFVLDGGADQDFHHISGLCQLATINGSFEELIVVGIATRDRRWELTRAATDPRYVEHAPRSGGAPALRSHLLDEVLPWVDAAYRTDGRRVLMGESLAGLFVVDTLLHTPAAFSHYVAVSPSLWWDDRALAREAGALLAAAPPGPRSLYLTMADEGGTMQLGLEELLAALRAAAIEDFVVEYVDRRGAATHATIYHPAAHDALLRFFGLPEPDWGPMPWYLIEGGSPGQK